MAVRSEERIVPETAFPVTLARDDAGRFSFHRPDESVRRCERDDTPKCRTPLTTFRMYSEMLAEDMVPGAERRKAYLETLRDESDRLATLVENALAYARLERGKAKVTPEATTLEALLDHWQNTNTAALVAEAERPAPTIAAAVLNVTEPHMTGMGGDMFAILWSAEEGRLVGLDASGKSGSKVDVDALLAEEDPDVPSSGPRSVTSPNKVMLTASAPSQLFVSPPAMAN